MFCSTCYEARLQACPETIELIAGLTAVTEYFWVLTSRTGKLYQRKVSTDATGKLIIDTTLLPDGLLNPHAGHFFLEIREGADYLNVVDLTLNGNIYNCVMLHFANIEGDAGINNIIHSTIAEPEV